MARNIAVSDEVYELLKKSKLPGESFSDVIKRGIKKNDRLADIIGSRTISEADWETARLHLLRAENGDGQKLQARRR